MLFLIKLWNRHFTFGCIKTTTRIHSCLDYLPILFVESLVTIILVSGTPTTDSLFNVSTHFVWCCFLNLKHACCSFSVLDVTIQHQLGLFIPTLWFSAGKLHRRPTFPFPFAIANPMRRNDFLWSDEMGNIRSSQKPTMVLKIFLGSGWGFWVEWVGGLETK